MIPRCDCQMRILVWCSSAGKETGHVGGFSIIVRKLFSKEWEKHYKLDNVLNYCLLTNQGVSIWFSFYVQLLKFSSELAETNQILHEIDYNLRCFTRVTISPKYHISLFKHFSYILSHFPVFKKTEYHKHHS